MSDRRTVLLDCDGVLADFIGEVIETIVAHGGPRHTRADITEFNFTAALKLDADLARLVKRTISTEPGWWYGLDPFPEAIEGVAKLREVAEVYVVTSPWNSHPNWLHEREAWLKKHFDIPHSHVIACSAKHLVRGDVFVDDKTEALIAWEQRNRWNIDGTVVADAIQWETPHNRLDVWRDSAWRRSTRDWTQLIAWTASGPDD